MDDISTSPLTLIQLVGEQTVQNLLPVLRLKPGKLIHFATPRTQAKSALIAEAARQAGHPIQIETITLSAMPGMRETHQAILAAIERSGEAGASAVVNFTGGTKLMSIGAYVAALKHKTPSLYVDTQDSLFVDGQTGAGLTDLLEGDLSFTPLLRSLSVSTIAAANGCPRVTAGHDWHPLLPLAEHLLANETDEEQTHAALMGPEGLVPDGREPRNPAGWLQLLTQPFSLPDTVCTLAAQSGLLRAASSPGQSVLPDETRKELEELAKSSNERMPGYTRRYFEAIAPIQRTISLLSGAWWEVILADRLHRCGRFRDIRWSVIVGDKAGPRLEEDIVALDGVQIVYVSCKRGGPGGRLLPLLNEINSRARAIGGTFTHRFLAIRRQPTGRSLADLRQRAGELGIRLLFAEQLEAADPFA